MSSGNQPARVANWLTTGAIAIALIVAIWATMEPNGWLDIAIDANAALFWLAVLAWIVCVIGAIVSRRRWWLLLTAPIVLFPAFLFGLLAVACMGGDCI